VDLGRFAGAAFLDLGALLAVGENKSFVILKESDKADADRNFRYFLESSDRFNELSRSRFGTVRARMMYTMSVAYDLVTRSIYTVTVPNTRVKRLVVSRFDRRDLTLSEEFTPTVSPTAGLMFAGRNRSLDELYITGTAIADGRMYAISAAYGTLLTIDLAAHTVVAAHTVAGLSHPVGLAIKGADLYVAGDDGRVWIVAKPAMPAAGAGPAAIH
jgi:disulfide bond formation protein DsbB